MSRKLKRLPHPPRVLIYSAYYDGVLAASAVVAEADGLVSKGGLGAELCEARSHGRRRTVVVPRGSDGSWPRRCAGALEDEEQAIFGMTLAGIAPAEIAETLGLSSAELESRLWEMLRKLENLDPNRGREPGEGRSHAESVDRGRPPSCFAVASAAILGVR